MVRPKKFRDGWSQWNIMRLRDYEEVYVKAEELARREGISTSEFVLKALANEVKLKIDGNPQIPLLPSSQVIDEYRNELAERRLLKFIAWCEQYPGSPIRLEEFEKVFNYVSRVRGLRPRVQELLERAVGLARKA